MCFTGCHYCNFSFYNYISIWPYYIVILLKEYVLGEICLFKYVTNCYLGEIDIQTINSALNTLSGIGDYPTLTLSLENFFALIGLIKLSYYTTEIYYCQI